MFSTGLGYTYAHHDIRLESHRPLYDISSASASYVLKSPRVGSTFVSIKLVTLGRPFSKIVAVTAETQASTIESGRIIIITVLLGATRLTKTSSVDNLTRSLATSWAQRYELLMSFCDLRT